MSDLDLPTPSSPITSATRAALSAVEISDSPLAPVKRGRGRPVADPNAPKPPPREKQPTKTKKVQKEEKIGIDDLTLPRSITIKLAKSVLPPKAAIQRNAVDALSHSAPVFVNLLSAAANDIALAQGRKGINAQDIIKALKEIEFDGFVPRIEAELREFTKAEKGRKDKDKGKGKAEGEGQAEEEGPEKKKARVVGMGAAAVEAQEDEDEEEDDLEAAAEEEEEDEAVVSDEEEEAPVAETEEHDELEDDKEPRDPATDDDDDDEEGGNESD
ncbi:histone-fold-containing protein [Pyronema domesticum]|uniref:DNA polymerase epsilon subunit D n=1 Tax=Pyronema omphalodes (strain CBS 100304) TaxID=1076935 RepID=U4L7G4_PYROM|nr:histone-fold-containing protein [Pyronema domesticum]CCX13108.1 Similar to DNA polymerase epsilon subunit D; acc. no. P87174 [Pyronema omphalodes CBS 100304]